MAFVESKWIKFLRQYGPQPRNCNQFDEDIQKAQQRNGIKPIVLEAEHLNEILDQMRSDRPISTILTGTAGDGKTYYCRQVWLGLGGTVEGWEEKSIVKYLPMSSFRIAFIRDLSEMQENERQILETMADAIVGENLTDVFLVAANDGQLLEAWKKTKQTPNVQRALNLIEDLLVEVGKQKEEFALRIYHLSRIGSSRMLKRVLDAVLEHPGWSHCGTCTYNTSEIVEQRQRCPIAENRERLNDPLMRKRLLDLVLLCELNENHLPVRQLFLLVANALLGHPQAKDSLMSCKEVPGILRHGTSYHASVYRNIFGENLTELRRERTEVFAILNRFGLGFETNNRIDNLLIFGSDDESLEKMFHRLVSQDSYFGADREYLAQQNAYLEGTSSEGPAAFLKLLSTQRQRLFFTIPADTIEQIKLW